VYIHVPERF